MTLSKKPYRGTRDFFPQDKRKLDFLFSKMHKVAKSFAYEPYDSPLVEPVDLYLAKSGEELINDQIYSFHDRGERLIAIRPEMTPSLARMVAQVHREEAKPLRWYSIPNLMRYEKPQRGRLREHWQFNCDIYGGPAIYSELEILSLLTDLLKSYGATSEHFEVLLNDRRIVDGFFTKVLKVNDEVALRLYKIIDKSKKVPAEAVEKMLADLLDESQTKNFFEYLNIKNFNELESFLEKHSLSETSSEFLKLIELSKKMNLVEFFTYDPSIVRGLDYYTGIVFEAFDKHPDNRRAICGGGSYSSLLKIFKEEPVIGVGFGLGDVTLKDFLETHNLLPELKRSEADLYISTQDESLVDDVIKLGSSLREELNVQTHLSAIKTKKVFSLCEKKDIEYAIFLGSNEIESGKVQVKNLKTRNSEEFSINDTASITKFIKG